MHFRKLPALVWCGLSFLMFRGLDSGGAQGMGCKILCRVAAHFSAWHIKKTRYLGGAGSRPIRDVYADCFQSAKSVLTRFPDSPVGQAAGLDLFRIKSGPRHHHRHLLSGLCGHGLVAAPILPTSCRCRMNLGQYVGQYAVHAFFSGRPTFGLQGS